MARLPILFCLCQQIIEHRPICKGLRCYIRYAICTKSNYSHHMHF
nr:MAG TPA: hypothetical protein [Caudoviricetes sp.]